MNALRRILLVFYSLVLLAALGGIGALAWNQDQQLDLDVEDLNIQAFGQSFVSTCLTVHNGDLLAGSADGKVRRIRATDGAVLAPVRWAFATRPAP